MKPGFENVLESNLEIKKCIHQLKMYDIPSNEIIDDIKNIILNSDDIQLCRESLSLIKNIDRDDIHQVVERLNDLILIRETYIKNQNNADDKLELEDMVNETYEVIETMIYESFKDIYDTESNYMEYLLENIDTVLEAPGTTAIKTVGSAVTKTGKAVVKGANAVWQALLNLLTKIREAFMSKHKKITERDAAWLKANSKTLLNLNTENMEINIHSDFKRNLNSANTTYRAFNQLVESSVNTVKKYDEFTAKIKQYTDSNGDLKNGLYNRYRTGNVNNEYSINVVRGNAIKNTIPSLITFCNDFINNYNDMVKNFKDSENFIKRLQAETKRRGVTEGYCYIEESLYSDTELGLIFDFDTVMEQENTNTTTQQTTTTVKTNTNAVNSNNNSNSAEKNNEKVGVTKRNQMKETTDTMNDSQLSLYNKICKDKHLGLTTYMTAMEKKYFESITILRGILKNKE